ncbi:unnamed protein product [Urochloa decumbens]|uniref:ARM repeat superfamily protein n=1 Tax=Urochloa decumbens TaxID=240449 RepID=A0ABC9BWY9_9POAL
MTTTAPARDRDPVPVDPTPHAVAAGGDVRGNEIREVLQRESSSVVEIGSADKVKKKLKRLDTIVFCVAFLEWAGNAVGTLASLWATVVLLGGFCSLLSPKDFWFATVMIFMEGTRSCVVFLRSDAMVNRWLFGSTSALRWETLSSPRMLRVSGDGKLIVVVAGVGIGLTPIEFRPAIVAGILKLAVLVLIVRVLLTRQPRGWLANVVLFDSVAASTTGGTVGAFKLGLHYIHRPNANPIVSYLKVVGILTAWQFGTVLLVWMTVSVWSRIPFMRKVVPNLCLKVVIASGFACLPFLQAVFASYYRYLSISVAVALQILSYHVTWELLEHWDDLDETWEERNASLPRLLLPILETMMYILFFWSVVFPLPGISFEISLYMLLSAIAVGLIANLQIPVAFLQVLLSILRLCSLLGHHHQDYHPLPDGTSPNFVPSIVVFFMLELCQGSSYMIASLLGIVSLLFRRSLARASGFEDDWGVEAVNLYFRQAYKARTETGLFRSAKQKYTPSLNRFAIESLGSTSSDKIQIVGLRILYHCLERGNPESNKKLITRIVKDNAKTIINKTIVLISYLTDAENSGDKQQKENGDNKWVRLIIGGGGGGRQISSGDKQKKKRTDKKKVVRLSLMFVRKLAINGGKISTRFRKELSESPFFLDSLENILNLEDCQDDLWEPVMDIIAVLALNKDARQEIGSIQSIIPKLINAFLISGRDYHSLRIAAGEALANLTIKSTDNCWAILLADPEHNVIKNLVSMLEDNYCVRVAADLLHNLCANSTDKLMEINFGATVLLESSLQKVMKMIRTKDGKELEAALCVASQISDVIPECFAQTLDTDAETAAELVQKLVDTLKSNKEPRLEYPRIRRVLIEMIISILGSRRPDRYKEIFRKKGAKEALDIVKGTPSRLEKYRVFLDGEGVVMEELHMRDRVDKAKGLIETATPDP